MTNPNKLFGIRLFTIAFILSIVFGCAEQAVKPAVVQETKKIVVFPVFSVIKEFRQYDAMVHSHLVAQLQSLGHEVVVVADEQYRSLRHHALEQSGSIYNPTVGDFIPLVG